MEKKHSPIILSIESSCDDTSVAVLSGLTVLSNVIATQKIHQKYGGVVPELASRKHMANIVPTIMEALEQAQVTQKELDALAFTQGPGLLGSLLVGGSFIKGMSLGAEKKMIAVNHMHAHIMAHFLDKEEKDRPKFPFLCLTVSGGHSQIVLVTAPNSFKLLGETMDDAAGEAFDKTAKVLGMDYPGGPLIDKLSQNGDPHKFKFTKPDVKPYHFSFSGVKTNVLQFLQRETRKNPEFISENLADICASVQFTIVSILLVELEKAAEDYGIEHLAIAGGVSANSSLRAGLEALCERRNWKAHIPKFEYCTDNAAMIGAVAYFKYHASEFSELSVKPSARLDF